MKQRISHFTRWFVKGRGRRQASPQPGDVVAVSRVLNSQPLMSGRCSRLNELSAGECLVAVLFPPTSAQIAGTLRRGCMVDVRTCGLDKATDSADSHLYGLRVWDVQNQNLESLTTLDIRKAALPDHLKCDFDFVPKYVIFQCSASEADSLIRLNRTGTLHLVLSEDPVSRADSLFVPPASVQSTSERTDAPMPN